MYIGLLTKKKYLEWDYSLKSFGSFVKGLNNENYEAKLMELGFAKGRAPLVLDLFKNIGKF